MPSTNVADKAANEVGGIVVAFPALLIEGFGSIRSAVVRKAPRRVRFDGASASK